MIQKKIIISIFAIYFLNGCVQSTALLGPAITVASTGNVYQAGLSYGSSKALTKITGRTTTENIKIFFEKNKDVEKKTENADDFINVVKKINKSSGIKNLASQ